MTNFERIDELIVKFQRDLASEDINSIIEYIDEPGFITTLVNNSESSRLYFYAVSKISGDGEYDLFSLMYEKISNDKKWRICDNKNLKDFYSECRSSSWSALNFKVNQKKIEPAKVDDFEWFMNSVVSEMLNDETPNFRNIEYYNDGLQPESLDEFYRIVKNYLLRNIQMLSLKKLCLIMYKNYKFLYYFMGDPEYDDYFKEIFDHFSREERTKNAELLFLRPITDYSKYVGLFCLKRRLNNYDFAEPTMSEDIFVTMNQNLRYENCENTDVCYVNKWREIFNEK